MPLQRYRRDSLEGLLSVCEMSVQDVKLTPLRLAKTHAITPMKAAYRNNRVIKDLTIFSEHPDLLIYAENNKGMCKSMTHARSVNIFVKLTERFSPK